MPVQVECKHCQRRFAADEKLFGKQVPCPDCQHTITIPPRLPPASPASAASAKQDVREIKVQCSACQRYFLASESLMGQHRTCPTCGGEVPIVPATPTTEGQTSHETQAPAVPSFSNEAFDNLSESDLLGATPMPTRKATAAAKSRLFDWNRPGRGGMPSYRSQLFRNPIRMLFLGAKTGTYQKDTRREPASRKQQFQFWVRLLLVWICAGIVLPTLAAILRNGVTAGLKMAGGVVVYGLGPLACYLIGLLAYAGALFEWKSFVNSRRMRATRTLLGDQTARKFYLGLSRVVMGLVAGAAILGTLVITLSFLLFELNGNRGQHVAARQDVRKSGNTLLKKMEAEVLAQREEVLEAASSVARFVENNEKLIAQIKKDPHNLQLRASANRAFTSGERAVAVMRYTNKKRSWDLAVRKLSDFERTAGTASSIYYGHRELPSKFVFSPTQLKPRLFPVEETRSYTRRYAGVKRAIASALTNPRTSSNSLERLAEELEPLQEFFLKIQKQFGYTVAKFDATPVELQLSQWQGRLRLLQGTAATKRSNQARARPATGPDARPPQDLNERQPTGKPARWRADADPFPGWDGSVATSLSLPLTAKGVGIAERILVPLGPSPYFAKAHQGRGRFEVNWTVYDTRTDQGVYASCKLANLGGASLPGPHSWFLGKRYQLAPSGEYLQSYVGKGRGRQIFVHALRTGKQVFRSRSAPLLASHHAIAEDLLTPNGLLLRMRATGRSTSSGTWPLGFQRVDLQKGTTSNSWETERSTSELVAWRCSPGGRYLLVIWESLLEVFEVTSGKTVGQIRTPAGLLPTRATAFSLDGTALAIIGIANQVPQLWCLDWTTGQTSQRAAIVGPLPLDPQPRDLTGPLLSWFPQNRMLMLNGRVILDRKTSTIRFRIPDSQASGFPTRVMGHQAILLATPGSPPRFQRVQMDSLDVAK